jgi:hypothetical protein
MTQNGSQSKLKTDNTSIELPAFGGKSTKFRNG